MIAITRISGLVEMPGYANETLFRMRLRKKYTTVLVRESPEIMKILQHIRNFVAYGKINPETLELLISKRGKSIDKKTFDAKKVAAEVEKKDLESLGLKPYFRLHPPRGGIKSKIHYPKGVLGDNGDDINELIRRML